MQPLPVPKKPHDASPEERQSRCPIDEPDRCSATGTKRNQLNMTMRDHLDATVPADMRAPRYACACFPGVHETIVLVPLPAKPYQAVRLVAA
jgi:hypothetical protein